MYREETTICKARTRQPFGVVDMFTAIGKNE